MIYPSVQILLILVFFLFSAFFSGIETGVISINRLRVLHRARNGSRQARIVSDYLRHTDRLLGTTLVGNNLVNVAISTLTASLAETYWGRWGQGLAAVVVALLIIVFCEYLPKNWFSSRPLERCLPFARLLRGSEWLLHPLASFVMAITKLAVPGGNRGGRSPFVTREHLQILTRDSEADGQISAFERLMIHRVLDLQVKTAGEILTPIDKVARVRRTASVADAIEVVRGHGHLKIPIFTDEDTDCVGVLYMQDVLSKDLDWEREPVAKHMLPPFFIDQTLRADDVLPLLRRHRQHIAFVRTREGRVCGIVTVENVLAFLMGNLPANATGERKSERGPMVVGVPPSARTTTPSRS